MNAPAPLATLLPAVVAAARATAPQRPRELRQRGDEASGRLASAEPPGIRCGTLAGGHRGPHARGLAAWRTRGAVVKPAPDGGVPGRAARATCRRGRLYSCLGAVLHRGGAWGQRALRRCSSTTGARRRQGRHHGKLEDLPVPALQPKAGETPSAPPTGARMRTTTVRGRQRCSRCSQACRKSVIDNGKELQQVFLHNVPRAMFILPLLAGL
jgi:hypothetical protein